MAFVLQVSVLFRRPLTFLIVMGDIGGWEGFKMASARTSSANKPAKVFILVHTVQLKPMIRAHFSGRMVSSVTSDVAFTPVYSEKTHLKKAISGHKKLTSTMKLRPECDGRLQISLYR